MYDPLPYVDRTGGTLSDGILHMRSVEVSMLKDRKLGQYSTYYAAPLGAVDT